MEFYKKSKIDVINAHLQDHYYTPEDLFKKKDFVLVRLEVKYAYLAVLNTLIKYPKYTEDEVGYLKENDSKLIEMLQLLANKKVDQEKMDHYMEELMDHQLIKKEQDKIYVGMFE